jgi:hypothetical protein
MPLVVFVRQKTTNSGFYGYITMSFFPALVSMFTSAKESMWCSHGNPAMLNNPNPLLSMAECCRCCSHLKTLNLNHFKMVEAMGSRFTSRRLLNGMAYIKCITKYIDRLKVIGGRDTQRHTDRLYDVWCQRQQYATHRCTMSVYSWEVRQTTSCQSRVAMVTVKTLKCVCRKSGN